MFFNFFFVIQNLESIKFICLNCCLNSQLEQNTTFIYNCQHFFSILFIFLHSSFVCYLANLNSTLFICLTLIFCAINKENSTIQNNLLYGGIIIFSISSQTLVYSYFFIQSSQSILTSIKPHAGALGPAAFLSFASIISFTYSGG